MQTTFWLNKNSTTEIKLENNLSWLNENKVSFRIKVNEESMRSEMLQKRKVDKFKSKVFFKDSLKAKCKKTHTIVPSKLIKNIASKTILPQFYIWRNMRKKTIQFENNDKNNKKRYMMTKKRSQIHSILRKQKKYHHLHSSTLWQLYSKYWKHEKYLYLCFGFVDLLYGLVPFARLLTRTCSMLLFPWASSFFPFVERSNLKYKEKRIRHNDGRMIYPAWKMGKCL